MKRNPLLYVLLLLIAAVAVGDCFWPYGPFRAAPSWPEEARTWEGVVTQQPRQTGRVEHLVVRLTEGGRQVLLTAVVDSTQAAEKAGQTVRKQAKKPVETTANLVATTANSVATTAFSVLPVAVGDLIAFNARIEPPHNAGNPGEVDRAAYLRHQGISGQAYCYAGQWRNVGRAAGINLRERMLLLRGRLVGLYAEHFDAEALAIISAMTLGDRARVDRSLRELYNRCGASHILALSGLHISILLSLLTLVVLLPLRRWGRVGQWMGGVVLLGLLWGFVLLAGLPVSMVRAATMFSVVIVLQLFQRNAPPFHSLIVALLLMLLWNPHQLFDTGLQLSAASVAAILFVGRYLEEPPYPNTAYAAKKELPFMHFRYWLEEHCPRLFGFLMRRPVTLALYAVVMLFAVSFAAQVATMPLVAHYFGRISVSGFVSSFIVIPAAYIVLFGALAFLLVGPLRPFIAVVLTAVVDWVHSVMRWMAALSCSAFEVSLSWWGVAGCYALLLWLVYCATRRRTGRLVTDRRGRIAAWTGRPLMVSSLLIFYIIAAETLVGVQQRPTTHIAIYNRADRCEIHCVTPSADSIVGPDSPHRVGNVVLFARHKVAVVDALLPRVSGGSVPDPLPVDVLLVSRGAKGHLDNMLQRYQPRLVALDGSLSDYYRCRYAEECGQAGLPLYDISRQGALILEAQGGEKK